MHVNLMGPIRLIQTALPFFRSQRSGTIVNMSSIAGLDARPATGIYAASKHALEGKFRNDVVITEGEH